MIKEAYCSIETMHLLHKKGFDEELVNFCQRDTDNMSYECCTHQLAMAWLREKYYIHIDIVIEGNGSCIEYVYAIRDFSIIFPTRNYDSINIEFKGRANTYEEAVEAALLYSLENLV